MSNSASRFSCRNGGLWFDDGNGEPQRLSDAFAVAGVARDDSGNPHYILDHNGQHFALPWEDVGERSGWRIMRRYVRRMPTNKRSQERLAEYLQTCDISAQWRLTDTAGWHGNSYILPNGECLGGDARIFFQQPAPRYNDFAAHGTLDDWRRQIGRYLAGNSRLCLLVGAAFAAPLLKLFNIEGGILHLYGKSSGGKSTAQRVALSVWGHGRDAGHSWNATGLALTNAAASRNDGLLSLDEIGEDSRLAVETCAYAIANGRARLQGAKEGGNRPELRFRVLAISSGEMSLPAHFSKNGREMMAGQMVRCPSIPHLLEQHHDFPDFRSFAEHLNHAAITVYGSAGRAFITQLTSDYPENVKAAQKAFETVLGELHASHTMTAQHARSARLFAVCAAGLMLASDWNISGIDRESARRGVVQCFADWYENQPREDYEDEQIRRLLEYFMQRHADSPRFAYWDSRHTAPDHAGYCRYSAQELGRFPDDQQEYWIIPPVFEDEIYSGRDIRKVCEILLAIGWLQPGDGRHVKRKRWGHGRFYVVRGACPPESPENDNDPKQGNPHPEN